ncbi:hypothetical protein [Burkholderia glumae]|uniref:hypothetical protein n=1 Tax=Burkholderia glumae TaxID=337 RepID=UPI00214A400D|nr:hypothetical protein [Burkholderia glumae]MCR1769786.1 hypothetical protein [Burkholderia glumae]UVT00080.1 hypothetical protein EFP19_31000 [Burkholderia glumae]
MEPLFEYGLSQVSAMHLRAGLIGVIGERLAALGLGHWRNTLELWLWYYWWLDERTGFDAYPVRDIHGLLGRALRENAAWSDEEFARELAQLPFLCWRARDGSGTEWVPLNQSFNEFAQLVRVDELRLWQSDRPRPDAVVTAQWLLQRLAHDLDDAAGLSVS